MAWIVVNEGAAHVTLQTVLYARRRVVEPRLSVS